jgi:ribosome biogenesis GTPase
MSMFGRLLQGIGGFYYALGDDGRQYTLRAQNKIRRVHLKPLVGDLIEFEPGTGEEDGWLKSILPRKNELVRPPVSNIDALVITVSCHVPAADLLLVDRMLVSAKRKGIYTLLALNKCDLANENALRLKAEYAYCGAQVFPVSALTGEGLDSLKTALRGKIHAFAGQSGVGKSSLINALYGTLLEVGDISRRIDRGKHTTRACRLLPVNEGAVLDTPGFSLFESESCEPEALAGFYKEFQPYADKCFFQPCCHDSEPHCAVKQALIEGSIPRGRYDRYIELLNEQRERWMKRYD